MAKQNNILNIAYIYRKIVTNIHILEFYFTTSNDELLFIEYYKFKNKLFSSNRIKIYNHILYIFLKIKLV
jgi:hypothetical protein